MVFEIGNTLGVKENITEKNLINTQNQRLRIDRFKFLVREQGMIPNEAKKIVIEEFKLERKPGGGGYLANVKPDGGLKFFQINLERLNSSDLLSSFKVSQSAILVKFANIFD